MSQRRLSRSTLGFRINFENLEDRSMLSAHSLLASSLHEVSSHHKPVNTAPAVIGTAVAGASQKSSLQSESHLSAQLVDAGSTATGKVNYETETEHGRVKSEFSVTVKGAAPSASLDVTIDGVIVGQIKTDSSGGGQLKFSTQPKGSAQAFPLNFPTINAGSVVSVGTTTGTLATGTSQEDSHKSETHLSAQLADAGTSATGKVQYETQTERGRVKSEFSVTVKGAAPNTSLDVTIDGVIVGQITTNSTGRGQLKFSTQTKGSAQAFPLNFPIVSTGSVVSVGTTTGTLGTGSGKGAH